MAYDGKPFITMQPEARRYPQPPMDTTEAAIRPMLSADLYAVVGETDGKGGNAVRLYHKPLVSWIWGGAFIMVLGGLVVGAGALWVSTYGHEFVEFSQSARVELRKVVWPTRQDTGRTTLVVFAFAVAMGVFFFLLDMLLTWMTRFVGGQ